MLFSKEREILFIINPISGTSGKSAIAKTIEFYSFGNETKTRILFTEYAGHARQIARDAAHEHVDIVVAVGGDGTVNEVGNGIAGSKTALGIIPTGSGNGLANELDIPSSIGKALKVIDKGNIKSIDAIKVDSSCAFVTAGVGFDALIADEFSNYGKRGPFSYFSLISKNLASYKAKTYNITIDGKRMRKEAFMITFANCKQFGNNVKIAPKAKPDDGYMDIVIVMPFSKWSLPRMSWKLWKEKLEDSESVEIIRAKSATIAPFNQMCHLDGEPRKMHKSLHLEVIPRHLRVIVSK